MAKVRYKEPSENYMKNYLRKDSPNLRSSIGNEGYVGEYYKFATDILIPYSKQARKIFNETEIDELAITIKENGIQNPLLVVPSKTNIDKFEVVSGERRLRAARKIGLEKIPCIIINEETAEEVALIENTQRTDLHPIEIADAILSLLEKPKWGDVTKLSEKIGKDPATVSLYMSYAKLPKEIKEILISKNIKSRDVLRKISRSSDLEEMKVILNGKNISSVAKSILRINLNNGVLTIQDKSVKNLKNDELKNLKNSLLLVLGKIDSMLTS